MTDQFFRGVELAEWAVVLVLTTKPVLRLLFGTPKRLDVIWAMVWFGTTNRLLFNAVLLWLPGSDYARDVAHFMAMMVAGTVLGARLMRAGEA